MKIFRINFRIKRRRRREEKRENDLKKKIERKKRENFIHSCLHYTLTTAPYIHNGKILTTFSLNQSEISKNRNRTKIIKEKKTIKEMKLN